MTLQYLYTNCDR